VIRSLSNGELPWLLPPDPGFRAKLNSLRASAGEEFAQNLKHVLRSELDLNRLISVDNALNKSGGSLPADAFTPLRIAFLSNGTTAYAVPAIRATCVRYGILADIYAPGYGLADADVFNSDSPLYSDRCNIAILAETAEALGLTCSAIEMNNPSGAVENALGIILRRVETLRDAGISVIAQTIPTPTDTWCGSLDVRLPGSVRTQIKHFNDSLIAHAAEMAFDIFDVDALAGLIGREKWFDRAEWYRSKSPFSLAFLPAYAEYLARIIGAMQGKSRKCLVLDLDNTIWGGTIGDDGLNGIRIGQGSPEGEAYLGVQAYAKSLLERGIILAVCSKNEDAIAKAAFENHPEMLLQLRDISIFVANWTDKASNLDYVAKSLNIGLDSLVFLDDNPAERARVRQMLPQVAVPEVTDDPSLYPLILSQAGYFEAVSLTKEDSSRGAHYLSNHARKIALEKIGDYDDYLCSLNMICEIRPFDDIGRGRIAQLINKSNQFNLTTRRYSESDVEEFQNDPTVFCRQIRLVDRFGDNGMISVVIFRIAEKIWTCDTWLMSCRVLGRRVEESVLDHIAFCAKAQGAESLIGEFLPSSKNMIVKDHFSKLGFCPAGNLYADGTRWKLDLFEHTPKTLPLKLIYSDTDEPKAKHHG